MKYSSEKLPELLYFGDPMCSWCWGIAPHLEKIKLLYNDKLDLQLVMGGLRPGGGDPWNDQTKGFLRSHWEHVHEASGQPFDYTLLDREKFNYDTEPPCRAVVVARSMAPGKEFEFFKNVQHRFYAENQDPGDLDFYAPICKELGIDLKTFIQKFESTEYKQATWQDFTKARTYGIKAFPSIILVSDNQGYLISHGYATFEIMKERIGSVLSQKAKVN